MFRSIHHQANKCMTKLDSFNFLVSDDAKEKEEEGEKEKKEEEEEKKEGEEEEEEKEGKEERKR